MAKIITINSIMIVNDGKTHVIRKEHMRFDTVMARARAGAPEAELVQLISVKDSVREFIPDVAIEAGRVTYKGVEIQNSIVNRIMDFIAQKRPHQPLVRFLDRMLKNPNPMSVEQLYEFLELHDIPIADNGTFLAFKAVRSDYKDKFSGTIDNTPGTNRIPEKPRSAVEANPARGMAQGYHVGSLAYAKGFAGGDDRVIVCEVDPADVVAVAYDSAKQKVRVTYYRPVADYKDGMSTLYVDRRTLRPNYGPVLSDNEYPLRQFSFVDPKDQDNDDDNDE